MFSMSHKWSSDFSDKVYKHNLYVFASNTGQTLTFIVISNEFDYIKHFTDCVTINNFCVLAMRPPSYCKN